MKKRLQAAALAALMCSSMICAFPFGTDAADTVYEFENGTIYNTGDNVTEAVTLTGASGGKAVSLLDSGDSVTLEVNAPADGRYTLAIRYSQPYDEAGKYQNVLVNGTETGQMLCAHTAENAFRTAEVSANLKKGKNTVTIEASWGWSYLDSLTVKEASSFAGMAANPVISRNVPAYSGSTSASSGNDAHYYSFWTSSGQDYLAYDLSSVPASQRKQVIAVWYNGSTFDQVGSYASCSAIPVDYTIEVNAAAGGSYPASGWKTVKTVQGNGLASRQHLVDLEGYNWIRINVTKGYGNEISMNFDVHDVSAGVTDSWIFFGDSITAGSMVNSYGTGYATRVSQIDSNYFPIQENGGIGGISSYHGSDNIEEWLADSPVKYVSIAYGTNDAWGNNGGADRYYESTKYMIDTVLAKGKIPVLPTIPYATNTDVNSYLDLYNGKIAQLYAEYGDKVLHGPDFYSFFKTNPQYLSDDGVHPNFEGYEAMRQLWAETMYETVYTKASSSADASLRGDVNTDGTVDAADVAALQDYILTTGTLTFAQCGNADLCEDGIVNSFDLAALKRYVRTASDTPEPPETPAFSAFYEAEDAKLAGGNQIINDSSASGGKAVGNFGDSSDILTFTVDIPTGGSYKLILNAMGLGGEKENNILVDGTPAGTFKSPSGGYTEAIVRRVMLTAGKHTITVTPTWGWIQLDSLKIEQDEVISDTVYNVENKLINPNATENTKKLFRYLCESYGNVTLSGQVCNDGLDGDEFKAIYEATGKYPAIVGLDMMDYTPSRTALGANSYAVDTAINFHNSGGIVTFCWHWNAPTEYLLDGNDANGSPRWWSGFSTTNTTFDIAAVMNGSDPNGKALIDRDIAEIAKQLHRMEDAGIPVLWRPLHEASGGWFWWGAKGPDAYKKFWVYLYEELTYTYGCNNLIWVWNGQHADWYPGDEYVDVIGEDIYAGERVYSAQNAKFSELLEYPDTNKIIALTENGTVPDIDNIVAANSHWAWFGTWCGDFVTKNGKYNDQYTEATIMKKTYQSEYVITLDELPDLY